MEAERSVILDRLDATERQLKTCQLELQDEKENRSSEASGWSHSVSEKSRLCEDFQSQVRELQNELASVRRKHAVNVKVFPIPFVPDFLQFNPISMDAGADSRTESDEKAN